MKLARARYHCEEPQATKQSRSKCAELPEIASPRNARPRRAAIRGVAMTARAGLFSAARQLADCRQRRAGFEQGLETRQDLWPADRNRSDQFGVRLVHVVRDRQLHHLARLLDLDHA